MHDTSHDDEFFDAIGDPTQIEEVRAQIEASRMSSPTKSNTSHTSFPSKAFQQTFPPQNYSLSRGSRPNLTLNLKRGPSDDHDHTLTISERERKEHNDHHNTLSPKNLQHILDRLDENSAILSHDNHGARSIDHDTTDSPAKRFTQSLNNATSGRPTISMFNSAGNNRLEDQTPSNRPSVVRTPKRDGSRTGFDRNPQTKKSFFSQMLSKKKHDSSEFSREAVKQHNKSNSNFDKVICLQYLEEEKNLGSAGLEVATTGDNTPSLKRAKNTNFTWIAKFSPNNRLLATGNSDGILRVYRVTIFDDEDETSGSNEGDLQMIDPNYMSFVGHKLDIIDVSWYKNSSFILTSAIDKKVILWNVESQSLVKIFEHSDIVPCLSFHPLVDEFFTTGCFDKMIRIWDINETKVVDWIQTNDLITALTFSPDKSFLLVGFYKGTVKIYRTDQGKLKFTMEITCKNTFSWGKLNKVGKKVTGIIFTEDYEFLVMTNDSRMRLVDLRTYETKIKYKGHSSGKYHIQPSYNYQKELIMSGSEDEKVYIWNKEPENIPQVSTTSILQKANRNTSYEYMRPFGKSNTTCAVWVPFEALQKYKEKVLNVWKDIYVDDLMVLFSSDSRIKVLGNLIELEPLQEKKKSG